MTTENFGGPPAIDIPGGSALASETNGLPAGPRLALSYRGEGGDLFLVMLKNMFLTLITLGIYTPWARTARRQYLWKQVDIGGHRLDWTGTGKELLIGYLKVLGGYLVFFGLPRLVARQSRSVGATMQGIGVILVAVLLPYAIYWSRRYLLGRTRWRGIRFGLAGEAGAFAKLWIKGGLLTVLTLGFYGPVLSNQIYGALIRNTHYGSASFTYDGRDGEAFKIAIKGFLLSLVTLGVYMFWYQAAIQRFRLSHTHLDRASGSFNVTGGQIFKLVLLNLFGALFTLGIAFPWLMTRTLRTIVGGISFEGDIDFAQILQQAPSGDAAGDALGGALGVELGV